MTDTKLSALTEDTSPTTDDIVYVVNDPGGTPVSRKVTLANIATLILTAPVIADFTNAQHDHGDADDGGGLPASSITSGTIATARLGSGSASASTFLAGDQSYKSPYVPYVSANDIFRCDSPGGDSSFTGTIATLPGGSTLTYNVGSGNEGAMVPLSTSHLGKMRLYNTTRGTNALISNCVTGTNTLTLTATVPAGWQVGDTITIASQTVSGSFSWVDIELSDPTLLNKSALSCFSIHRTAATAGDSFVLHPTETYGTGKIIGNNAQVLNIVTWLSVPILKLNSNLFSLAWNGSPTFVYIRVAGYVQ